MHWPLFDFLYKRMHYGTAPVYHGQYHLFGDQQVMPVKILWDYMVYWTLSGYVFCHGKTFDLSMYARHFFKLKRLDELNRFMQKFFRLWHAETPHWESTGEIDAWEMPVIIDTNRALRDKLDDAAFASDLRTMWRRWKLCFGKSSTTPASSAKCRSSESNTQSPCKGPSSYYSRRRCGDLMKTASRPSSNRMKRNRPRGCVSKSVAGEVAHSALAAQRPVTPLNRV